MKVGIIADTHDNLINLKKAADIFKERKIDTLLHAGDFVAPFVLRALVGNVKVLIGVFGNNDGDKLMLADIAKESGWELHSPPYSLTLAKRSLLMLHEPDILETAVKSSLYEVIIYGHTHKRDIKRERGTLIINPGEAGGWLTGKGSVVILDLNEMKEEIFPL